MYIQLTKDELICLIKLRKVTIERIEFSYPIYLEVEK